jgi:hypothetical protein
LITSSAKRLQAFLSNRNTVTQSIPRYRNVLNLHDGAVGALHPHRFVGSMGVSDSSRHASSMVTLTFSTSVNTTTDDQDPSGLRDGFNPEDETMLNLLIEYKEKNGDCHVPSGNNQFARAERKRLGVSNSLGVWVAKQRTHYRLSQGKKVKLDQSLQIRIVILESMGFMWLEREAQWQRSFNRMEAHKAKHGTLHVDREQDPQLWTWLDQQRKAYQKGILSEERLPLLQEIGFVFDLQEAKWWEHYERLGEYKKEHGDTLVPAHSYEDPSFGAWVARQRRLYSVDQMTEERIEALEKIEFSWDPFGEAWENFYEQLCQYHAKHGHTRVGRSEGPLWHWVDRQRRLLRKLADESQSAVDMDKIAALDKVGFSWSEDPEDRSKRLKDLSFKVAVHEEIWKENFKGLCSFKDRFGHFSIASDLPEYQELSNWVRHQRFLHKRGKLPDERVVALEGIDFAWTAQAARWDVMYENLVRFHAEHGHTRIPTRNTELYRWTNQQRKALRSFSENDGDDSRSGRIDQRLLALEKLLDE